MEIVIFLSFYSRTKIIFRVAFFLKKYIVGGHVI